MARGADSDCDSCRNKAWHVRITFVGDSGDITLTPQVAAEVLTEESLEKVLDLVTTPENPVENDVLVAPTIETKYAHITMGLGNDEIRLGVYVTGYPVDSSDIPVSAKAGSFETFLFNEAALAAESSSDSDSDFTPGDSGGCLA